MSGHQYYWLIASGLLLALPLGVFSTLHVPWSEISFWSTAGLLVLGLFPCLCYNTVWWEIFSNYRWRAVLAILVLMLSALFTQGWSLVAVIFMPHIYWAARINGVPFEHDT